MYALYNALLAVPAAVALPVLRLPWLAQHRERLGLVPEAVVERIRGRRVVWLHNASVGEFRAATALLDLIRSRLPERAIVLSTTSLAGRDLARRETRADGAFLLPLDTAGCVSRTVAAISPEVFLFTETEIWPNLLRELSRRRVPAALLSGRISARSFPRYLRLRPFVRRVLSQVAFFGMQSEEDAARIRALGAPRERVRVTGSLKLDRAAEGASIRVEGPGPVWVAGSTRPGEEELCLRAFARARERHPDLRLALAPRHLDRVPEVEALVRSRGFESRRRTELRGEWPGAVAILVVDTLGELAGLYGRADVAFVGGTLVPLGGHNLLEPARAGVPVLYGPHVENVADAARTLEEAGGGLRVDGAEALGDALERLLGDDTLRRRMGESARGAFAAGRVAETTFEALEPWLS